MATLKKLTKRGFTLIELMIVVVIIGILASLAIYGVQKYVANSKSAEARTVLGRIAKDALVAFEGENAEATILALGGTAGSATILCDGAAAKIPTAATVIKGNKYQPSPSEWAAGNMYKGWACLGTSVTTPIYYMYNYSASTAAGPAAAAKDDLFVGFANGDLDGDGNLSTFTMGGTVLAEGNTLVLVLQTAIKETNPEE